jgi:hypothetical protein
MSILSINADAKTIKGTEYGVLTGILYLAPANESGVMNTCAFSSAGCREACLFSAGRGAFKSVINARVKKTLWFFHKRSNFLETLKTEISALIRKATKENKVAAIRLNGTSDLPWENIRLDDGKTLMETFPTTQFYDYTPNPHRMMKFAAGLMPANYHLTFSRKEDNQEQVQQAVDLGVNIAVVFRGGLPATYLGRPVIDGDVSDIRFNDPKNSVVGLKAKGKARKQDVGFVIEVAKAVAA